VDEPTSGLSSRDSENIMDLLNELAQKGKLIYVVIHQPSSEIFKMFDSLMILDTGGYPIYYGNPVDAVIYFKQAIRHVGANESECPSCGNVNPELIFNIIETKVVDEYGNITNIRKLSPKDWNQLYLEDVNPALEKLAQQDPVQEKPKGSYKVPSFLKQLKVFTTRDVLSKVANLQYMLINFLEAPILAFILAYLVRYFSINNEDGYVFRFNENIPAFLFMSVVVSLFMGLTVSAEEIISDQKILKREKFLDLSRLSYLKSKLIILFFISAIQTLTFVLVGNSILGIQDMYLPFWFILFTTSCFANILGLNISATFSSVKTIYIFIPIILIPQLLLSGVIVNFDKLNPSLSSHKVVPLTGELMTSRWAFEAMATYQFMHNPYDELFYKYNQIDAETNYIKNFWTKDLIARVNQISKSIKLERDLTPLEDDWRLIQNELNNQHYADYLNLSDNKTKFDKQVNEVSLKELHQISQFLANIEDASINKNNENADNKNQIIYRKMKGDGKKLLQLQFANSNESLNDLLTNHTQVEKILRLEDELVRKESPIYNHSPSFRSHFFAPTKVLFGKRMETFWVNNIVIWLMSAFLFVVLYFDGFLRLLNLLSSPFERKR
jgi:energy-coupling factor transporter ATP-binding protein EcfA2